MICKRCQDILELFNHLERYTNPPPVRDSAPMKAAYNNTPPHVKNLVRQVRNDKGLTIEGLSELSGIDWQKLQKYETGRTRLPIDALIVIANALEVPPSQLIPNGDGLTDDERELINWMREHPRDKAVIKSTLRGLRESAKVDYVHETG